MITPNASTKKPMIRIIFGDGIGANGMIIRFKLYPADSTSLANMCIRPKAIRSDAISALQFWYDIRASLIANSATTMAKR
jgi:hypothetical protein